MHLGLYLKNILYNIQDAFFLERPRWFIWSPVLFALGIGIYFSLPFEVSKWIVLFLLEILIVLAFLFRHNYRNLFILYNVFTIVLGFAIICLQTHYKSKKIYVPYEGKTYITAKVNEIDYNYRGKQRLTISNIRNFEKEEIKGSYRITLNSENKELEVGNCFEAVVDVEPAKAPIIIGGYNMKRQMFYDEITGVGYSPSRVLKIECEDGKNAVSFISKVRHKISNRIFDVLPNKEASIVNALITGEQGRIKQELRDNYRDSGLAHFLSISGLHMSMIAGLVFFIVRFVISIIPQLVSRFNSKKIAAIFAIIFSSIYLFISGAEIPAQRAFIMTTIVLIGVLLDRIAISMRVVSISAFIVLLISPEALIGPSFQMSFTAVIALVAFYERYASSIGRFFKGDDYRKSGIFIKFIKICWIYMIGILLTDIVASLTTSVFAAYHFNRVAIYTTLGNMLSGPIIGFIVMPFLLFSLVLMPFGLDYIPLKITGWGVSLVNDITKDVSSLPNASLQVMSFPTWSIILMVFGFLWLCIWHEKWRKWGWFLIIIGFLGVFTVSNPDIIVSNGSSVVAVKDNKGKMVILPAKRDNLIKKVWLEKTASTQLSQKKKKELSLIYNGDKTNSDWLDMECRNKYCDYKNRVRIYKDGILLDIKNNKKIDISSGGNIRIYKEYINTDTFNNYYGKRVYSK